MVGPDCHRPEAPWLIKDFNESKDMLLLALRQEKTDIFLELGLATVYRYKSRLQNLHASLTEDSLLHAVLNEVVGILALPHLLEFSDP